jgi:hypothetical protein
MLHGLKRQCEAVLRHRLNEVQSLCSAQNSLCVTDTLQCSAVSMLRSADVCNAAYLREACVSYIVDHFKDIVITEQ